VRGRKIDCAALDEVRGAIASGDIESVARSLDATSEAHWGVLLALTADERRALARSERFVSILNTIAYRWMNAGRANDALTLFDDLIEAPRHSDLALYNNALWAVMADNHRAAVKPERARRYLARCLRYARQNPAIYFNAACVAFELGDREEVIAHVRDAVRFGYEPLDAIRNDPLLAPLKSDPRFVDALDDEALHEERRAYWLPTAAKGNEVDWPSVFEEASPVPGASEPALTVLRELWRPLDDEDWPWLAQPGEREAATTWTLNGSVPPTSYVDFLRFSNGGTFRNGERRFSSFFAAHTLRGMMLGYGIPEEMPSVLPFAFDGGGVFIAFDMRLPPVNGEFPVVAFHASTPCWAETSVVADSFEAACRGRTRV
jgi:hypothetical protein